MMLVTQQLCKFFKIASYAKTVKLIEKISTGFYQGQGNLAVGVKMKVLLCL